jgi:hypothetical protein
LRRVTELVRICRALAGGHGALHQSATLESGEVTVQARVWGRPPDCAQTECQKKFPEWWS